MLELSCNLYSGGNLVVTDLRVWVHAEKGRGHGGLFRMPTNLEFLAGAKYKMELLGNDVQLLSMPGGPSMDLTITGVSGRIAHFAPITAAG